MSEVAIKKDSQQEWQFLPIKDFAHTTSGGTPRRGIKEYYNGDVPWIKSGDLNDNQLNSCDEFITQLGLEKSSAKLFKPGTILIALYGATIGRLSILNFEAASNQAVCGITLPENVDVKYIFYYLLSIRRKLIAQGKGGAQPNINQQIVKETIVPLAPPEQQKRIVAKIEELFSHIDAGIDALKKAKQLLKQYRQSVLKAAVTGELTKEWRAAQGRASVSGGRKPGATEAESKYETAKELLERIQKQRKERFEEALEDWNGLIIDWESGGKAGKKPSRPKKINEFDVNGFSSEDLPGGWINAPLAACAEIDIGFAFKSKEFVTEGIPLLRGDNIEPGKLRWANRKCWPEDKLESFEHLLVNEGDVILAMDRPVISSGLKIAIAKQEDLPALLVQRVARLRASGYRDSKYVFYALSTENFINHCLGSQTGTQLPHISGAQIEGYVLGFPPVLEQEVIVVELENRIEAIRRTEVSIERQLLSAEKNKQAVLVLAFSGDLVGGLDSDGSAKEILENIRQQKMLESTKEKLTKKRGPIKKKGEPMGKKKIIDVLKASGQALSPEKLFDLIGADGSSPDDVEGFYIELKETLSDKHVVIEPVLDNDVKQGDLILYKVEA